MGLASLGMDERRQTPRVNDGPCGGLRQRADSICARASELKEVASVGRAALLQARREQTRVQHLLDEARAAADPARISRGKADARAAYRRIFQSNPSAPDRQRAATTWLHEIDRLNREARRANRALSRAEAAARDVTQAAYEAERRADAARIAAESAAAACTGARQHLATCEGTGEEVPVRRAAAPIDDSEASGSMIREAVGPAPLVIERIAAGDREAMRAVAEELASLTSQPVSHYLLLLREFVDALRNAATERLYLAFRDDHPLWSQFNREERQAIVRALSDLGFRYDQDEGWYGGRMPGTSEMAMALAYAGHDPRTIRRQPTPEELRTLPSSMVPSPVECLAALAPNLTLTQMFGLLGAHADSLGALWDDWARLRPLLLSDTGSLVPA